MAIAAPLVSSADNDAKVLLSPVGFDTAFNDPPLPPPVAGFLTGGLDKTSTCHEMCVCFFFILKIKYLFPCVPRICFVIPPFFS